jgi:hypothetical protein
MSSDGRSVATRVKVDEIEAFVRQAKRKLARIEGCVNDAKSEGRKTLTLQYWQSSKLAMQRLDAVANGIEKAT